MSKPDGCVYKNTSRWHLGFLHAQALMEGLAAAIDRQLQSRQWRPQDVKDLVACLGCVLRWRGEEVHERGGLAPGDGPRTEGACKRPLVARDLRDNVAASGFELLLQLAVDGRPAGAWDPWRGCRTTAEEAQPGLQVAAAFAAQSLVWHLEAGQRAQLLGPVASRVEAFLGSIDTALDAPAQSRTAAHLIAGVRQLVCFDGAGQAHDREATRVPGPEKGVLMRLTGAALHSESSEIRTAGCDLMATLAEHLLAHSAAADARSDADDDTWQCNDWLRVAARDAEPSVRAASVRCAGALLRAARRAAPSGGSPAPPITLQAEDALRRGTGDASPAVRTAVAQQLATLADAALPPGQLSPMFWECVATLANDPHERTATAALGAVAGAFAASGAPRAANSAADVRLSDLFKILEDCLAPSGSAAGLPSLEKESATLKRQWAACDAAGAWLLAGPDAPSEGQLSSLLVDAMERSGSTRTRAMAAEHLSRWVSKVQQDPLHVPPELGPRLEALIADAAAETEVCEPALTPADWQNVRRLKESLLHLKRLVVWEEPGGGGD